MDMITVSAKSVEEAVTKALITLEVTSDKLEYEVVDKGSQGFLGIGSKPAVIRAKKKDSIQDSVVEFLGQVFDAMSMDVEIVIAFNEEEREMNVDLSGGDMGILIGKRGQTLDSLQYLVSLVVNKKSTDYIRVKLDTENYRERRRETLETLAKNIAYKVKRTRRSVSLEPMNPYERRIIHSALQNDKYVVTKSDGDEPFRHVVISLKREGRRERSEHGTHQEYTARQGRGGRQEHGERLEREERLEHGEHLEHEERLESGERLENEKCQEHGEHLEREERQESGMHQEYGESIDK